MTVGARRRAGIVAVTVSFAAASLMLAAPAHADSIRGMEWWLSSYGVTQAWNTTQGAGVTVAVLDTGVDGSIPELRGAVVGGTDESGEGSANGQTPVGSESGHGTWVASMLAGRGSGPGNGVIGVAPQASILSVSLALGSGGTKVDDDDQVADGVRWAVDHGASVINLSLTRNTLGWPTSWDSAFLYAEQHNVVIVAAAGNRGSGTNEVGAPATIPGVLAVGGVTEAGVASASASSQGITIGVMAPSENLVAASPGGGYVSWSGTSGAAPIVAGAVALVRAAHPQLDAANVVQRIIATARPVAGQKVPDPIYGYGLLDVAAAVSANVAPVSANPLGSLSQWITMHRRAPSAQPALPAWSAGSASRDARTTLPLIPPPGSVLWPVLTDVSVPLLALVLFAATVVVGVRSGRRRFGRPSG